MRTEELPVAAPLINSHQQYSELDQLVTFTLRSKEVPAALPFSLKRMFFGSSGSAVVTAPTANTVDYVHAPLVGSRGDPSSGSSSGCGAAHRASTSTPPEQQLPRDHLFDCQQSHAEDALVNSFGLMCSVSTEEDEDNLPMEVVSSSHAAAEEPVSQLPALTVPAAGEGAFIDSDVMGSPTKKSKTTKKSVQDMHPSSQNVFLRKFDVVDNLIAVTKVALEKDERASDDKAVAMVLQLATAQITNSAHNVRGAGAAMSSLFCPETGLQHRTFAASMNKDLANSMLVRGIANTYKQQAPKSFSRLRALSTLAESFTLDELNDLVLAPVGEHITNYAYNTAKRSSLSCGVGIVPEKKRSSRRKLLVVTPLAGQEALDVDGDDADDGDTSSGDSSGASCSIIADSIAYAVDFGKDFVTPLAFGTRVMDVGNGVSIPLAKHELTRDGSEVVFLYFESFKKMSHTEKAEREVIPLADAHFRLVLKALSGGENVNLTALDAAHWKLCVENGERQRMVIRIITEDRPNLRKDLLEMQLKSEGFMSSQYPLHLFPDSKAHSHSKNVAFGYGERLAQLDRAEYCAQCSEIERLIMEIKAAIGTANLKPEEETADELLTYFNKVVVEDIKKYLAHVVRKTHDVSLMVAVYDGLDRERGCVVRQDYKMKQLPLVWRESMPQFFGKRGFTWCGVAITRYKTAAERTAPVIPGAYSSEIVTEFFDVLSDDSKEDGYSART
jgi:hypothetical protein